MLCFVCTDAEAEPGSLREFLIHSTQRTFNRMTIDGDMSTNDTVLLLANGQSRVAIDNGPARQAFQETLDDAFKDLARQLVKDGEGVTKLVDIVVRGAASIDDAEKVADTVANSNLVKTAFFGEDANWGRILGAAGRAGVRVIPETIDVFFDAVQMVRDGMGCGRTAETQATEVLKKPEFEVTIDLKMGGAAATVLTCDFSVDYVRINADYRS
jgi:glutamate N-acetyltransferase/amino-acid N-acetyltransferase